MKQYNSLLEKIAATYCISQGTSETVEEYKVRIIYSAVAASSFASLWDVEEDGESISIVHFKRKIEELLQDYRELYPEISTLLPADSSELADEIYSIYSRSGVLYHEPNRVIAAIPKSSVSCGILFTRAFPVGKKQSISGAGTYLLDFNESGKLSLADVFQLNQTPLEEVWHELINNPTWNTSNLEQLEFIAFPSSYQRKYWLESPMKNGNIYLCRSKLPGVKSYYLYRYSEGRIETSPIPQWKLEFCMGEDGNTENHRLFSNSCLKVNHMLPPSTYHVDGEIVYIKIGYRMPPAEESLMNLYTWPLACLAFPQNFNRICTLDVFFALADALSLAGFEFVEI